MDNLNGTFTWHYIDYGNKLEELNCGTQYLVCMETSAEKGSAWHLELAYWYKAGDKLTIYEKDGTPHYFKFEKDGFYSVNEMSDGKSGLIFRLIDVRYWTEIMQPGVNPDDVLTIM